MCPTEPPDESEEPATDPDDGRAGGSPRRQPARAPDPDLRDELLGLRSELRVEVGHLTRVLRAEAARLRRELSADIDRAVDRLSWSTSQLGHRLTMAIVAANVLLLIAAAVLIRLGR